MKTRRNASDIVSGYKEYVFNIEDARIIMLSDYDIQNNVVYLSDFTKNMHIHTHYEIFYVATGVVTVKFDSGIEEFVKGDVFIIPPRVKHMVLMAEQGSTRYGLSVSFQKNSLKGAASIYDMMENLMTKDTFVVVKDVPVVEDIFKKIAFDEIQRDEMSMSLHIHELFTELLRKSGEESGYSVLESKLSDSNMMRLYKLQSMLFGSHARIYSLNDIAEELFLSTRQVSRIIQQYYGCTYRELVATSRIELAAGLLEDTDMNILEVASKAGYNSIKGFYTNFKDRFDCLPSEYRKMKKLEKEKQEILDKDAKENNYYKREEDFLNDQH